MTIHLPRRTAADDRHFALHNHHYPGLKHVFWSLTYHHWQAHEEQGRNRSWKPEGTERPSQPYREWSSKHAGTLIFWYLSISATATIISYVYYTPFSIFLGIIFAWSAVIAFSVPGPVGFCVLVSARFWVFSPEEPWQGRDPTLPLPLQAWASNPCLPCLCSLYPSPSLDTNATPPCPHVSHLALIVPMSITQRLTCGRRRIMMTSARPAVVVVKSSAAMDASVPFTSFVMIL